jgi:hypothetical protein
MQEKGFMAKVNFLVQLQFSIECKLVSFKEYK